MAILLDKQAEVPPPPEGDPRRGMRPEESQFFVAVGEKLDFTFERLITTKEGQPFTQECYWIKWPSGYEDQAVHENLILYHLRRMGVIDEQRQRDILFRIQTKRRVTYWPHEDLLRTRLEVEGKAYYG